MGTSRAGSWQVTFTVDGPPQLTPQAAPALLALVQHLVEFQDQDDGRDIEEAIAS